MTPPSSPLFAARRVAKIVAINFAVLVGLAVVTELALGSWIFGPDFGALTINKNRFKTRDVSDLYDATAPVIYRRDRYGLRGDYGALEDIDILAVGGSTTNEAYVSEGETWVDVLRTRLRAAGHDLSVANAGVDGHSTVAHIKAFDEWFAQLPDLRPRFVLMYVGINDALLPASESNPADTMVHASVWRRAHTYVGNHSAFVHAFKVANGWTMARHGGVTHGAVAVSAIDDWVVAEVPEDLHETFAVRLANYVQRLRALSQRVGAMGATPIFITQTHGYAKLLDGEIYEIAGSRAGRRYAELRLFDRIVLDHCRQQREPCIDLDSEISLQPADFYDSIHTTPSGSRKIGEFLTRSLQPIITATASD